MFVPIINIALGIGMVLGGLSGKVALVGTGSTTALVAVGAVVAGLGVFQLVRSQRNRGGA